MIPRNLRLLIFLLLASALQIIGAQTPVAPAGRVSSTKAAAKGKPAPAHDFTVDGKKIIVKLDHKGTDFSVESANADALWVSLSFTIADGCNHWFSKSATFILNERTTITIPWAAQCPLPPESRIVPIWLLESLARAETAVLALDGTTSALNKSQLAALRSFYDSNFAPDPAWRAKYEPYLLPDTNLDASGWIDQWLAETPTDFGAFHYSGLYVALFTDSPSGAELKTSGALPDDGGMTNRQGGDTYEFKWNDLHTGAIFLSCGDSECIHGKHEWSFYSPAARQRIGDSQQADTKDLFYMMFTLYGHRVAAKSPDSTDAETKLLRALTYLWYKHMFVNVGR